ncbi:LOW QUALITY PROTEIN: protein smoothened [Bemisia tabaci]|uniref:LOW QUALITY PROTEIN: protein smoothened n=1 Tax=Bemisia tabaci TaxID=7038 RepID=UPI003B287C1D
MPLCNNLCRWVLLTLLPTAVLSLDRAGGVIQPCPRPAKCQPLNTTLCMGAQLKYSSTTLDLIDPEMTQEIAQEHLEKWRGLISLPKCWSVVQPFLCSLYMPKCENGTVFLPSVEMCKSVTSACRILAEFDLWPSYFRCDDNSTFGTKCKNDVLELKFNTTGQCKAPLVPVDQHSSYYDGVEGCGVPCDEPMLTPEELSQVRQWATVGAIISGLFNGFTVITFLLDWKSSNKYPALVVFYINLCFLIVCMGWLYPVLFNSQKDIICRKDKTLRTSEPSVGENLSCIVNFVLVYYFLIASIVWFVIQTYAWHITFQALGKIQSKIDKQGAYFHLAAWSLPLVLTITVMALSKVDASSVFGICFVGGQNPIVRTVFLLVPLAVALLIGGFYLGEALLTLIRLIRGSKEIICERATRKIRDVIVKMLIFMIFIILLVSITLICHMYQFEHVESWKLSFRQYIVCQLGISFDSYVLEEKCRMKEHPSVFILQLQVLALFSTGVLMSMWVWNKSSFVTWERFFSKRKEEKEVKVQKHKIIATAYAKRKSINSGDGRFSITFPSSRQDPVGFDFELDSVGTKGDLSSTWAAALPKFVLRRGALTVGGGSSSSQRRNSFGSEVSYSVRRVSVESRRHSLDSTVSVQAVELTGVVRNTKRHMRHKKNRPRESSAQMHVSQESTLGAQILSALSMGTEMPESAPNLKRRTANAGLDSSLDAFAGKLLSQLNSPEFNSSGITSDLSESSTTDHFY